MGSSPLLRTHKPTIVIDLNGQVVLKFFRCMSIQPEPEPIYDIEQVPDDSDLNTFDGIDSMEDGNKRGCDEIML